jgi:adenosine deaminase
LTHSPDPGSIPSASAAELRALPKVDLHRHLEGSLRLSSLQEIAIEADIDLPTTQEELQPLVQMVAGDSRDPQTFLTKFKVIRQFFRSSEIIQRLVRETVEDAAFDGVKLLELRFTPVALQQFSGLSLEQAMDAVLSAVREAAEISELTVGLIVSINRHEPVSIAEEVVQIAVDRLPEGILGLDLAGDEQASPMDPFLQLFKEAKQAGLKLTIHAGEWGGPEHVAQAIEAMSADRIGHGVRSMEDPGVVQLARKLGVGFEVSPTSNLRTGVFQDANSYPLAEMIAAGLRVAITTDDPAVFGTTLSAEHEFVIKHLGFSVETIKGLTLQALQLSFINERQKRALETSFSHRFWPRGD